MWWAGRGKEDYSALSTALLKFRFEIIDHNGSLIAFWGFGREELFTITFICPKESLPGILNLLRCFLPDELENSFIYTDLQQGERKTPVFFLIYMVFPIKVNIWSYLERTLQHGPTDFRVTVPLFLGHRAQRTPRTIFHFVHTSALRSQNYLW